jgi:hypothetical protein
MKYNANYRHEGFISRYEELAEKLFIKYKQKLSLYILRNWKKIINKKDFHKYVNNIKHCFF